MKLLLIDTDAARAAYLGGELREFGYAVDRVVDGRRALERAVHGDYDVIVLDLTLPRDECLPILHEIRETDRDVAILVLSDGDQVHDRVTALIQGADDFLVKPVTAGELHARLRRLPTGDAGRPVAGRQRLAPVEPLNFRLGELLRYCEQGEIELVISEVPLAALLQRINAALEATAVARDVCLLLPRQPLPTLLIDAGWMQQLLASLLFNALLHGKPGSCVELRVDDNVDNCRIDIESACGLDRDLPLARRLARQLNLRVASGATRGGLLRVSIDGIKIR